MNPRFFKLAPLLVSLAVLGVLYLLQRSPAVPLLDRLEWITYDWRARLAARLAPANVSTPLAAVILTEECLEWLETTFPADWPVWPMRRHRHAQMVRELNAQGASLIAYDIFFPRVERSVVTIIRGGVTNRIPASEYFAESLKSGGNVILNVPPYNWRPKPGDTNDAPRSKVVSNQPILTTNALAVGHTGAVIDHDGTLRRLFPYFDDPVVGRVWQLGLVAAAHHLKADLSSARILPDRIILACAEGGERIIPLNPDGTFLIDWPLGPNPGGKAHIPMATVERVLRDAAGRAQNNPRPDPLWTDKIVFIGSTAAGGNIGDRKPTSLSPSTPGFLAHVNAAHSLVSGRFLQATPLWANWLAFAGLTFLAALAGRRWKPIPATLLVGLAALAYFALAAWLFVEHRRVLPVALPIIGALIATHLLVTVLRTFELRKQRQLEAVFSKVVAPEVMEILIREEHPSLEASRRAVSVMFADIRGFTRFAEDSQARAEEAARALKLPEPAARAHCDQALQIAMISVNQYLCAIVDEVKAHRGTLDKYMGDCVMAFWGAPVNLQDHGMLALRCAVAAQQRVHRINQAHREENRRREEGNTARAARGEPAQPLFPVLQIGVGLNSGLVTAGFMGSDSHLSSYTVFGHAVNLASRVEGLAGPGQIVITHDTFTAAGSVTPDVSLICSELPAVVLKGIANPVRVYEIQWRLAGGTSEPESGSGA